MTERSRDDLERTAWHEAAHASIAFICGRRVGVVSIRPAETHSGVAFSRSRAHQVPPNSMLRATLGRPVPLLPATLRRHTETAIMVALAGDEATRFWTIGFVPMTQEDEQQAAKLAEGLVRLSAPELEQFERTQREGPKELDQDNAWKLASALVGEPDESIAYLGWLRACTRGIVWGPRCQRLIAAVSAALLEHEVLSGRAVTAVLREADARPWVWEAAASTD